MTVICYPCLLHKEYGDMPEKEQQVIEMLPQLSYLKLSAQQQLPERITIEIAIQQYDLDKMRHIKTRLQRIKDLVTRYSSLSTDRMACLQSPIKQTPYMIEVDCILNQEHTGRELVWKQDLTELEKIYIRRHHILSSLCCWWEDMMKVSVVGIRQPIISSAHEKVLREQQDKSIAKTLVTV